MWILITRLMKKGRGHWNLSIFWNRISRQDVKFIHSWIYTRICIFAWEMISRCRTGRLHGDNIASRRLNPRLVNSHWTWGLYVNPVQQMYMPSLGTRTLGRENDVLSLDAWNHSPHYGKGIISRHLVKIGAKLNNLARIINKVDWLRQGFTLQVCKNPTRALKGRKRLIHN